MSAVVDQVSTFIASAAIGRNLIVKPSSVAGQVALAVTDDKKLIGVTLEATNAKNTVPVQVSGIARVRLGGTVNYGDYIKPNASGMGIAATAIPEDFTNREWNAVIGVALASGVSGDIIPVLIQVMVILQ